jgi:hypothetical protein
MIALDAPYPHSSQRGSQARDRNVRSGLIKRVMCRTIDIYPEDVFNAAEVELADAHISWHWATAPPRGGVDGRASPTPAIRSSVAELGKPDLEGWTSMAGSESTLRIEAIVYRVISPNEGPGYRIYEDEDVQLGESKTGMASAFRTPNSLDSPSLPKVHGRLDDSIPLSENQKLRSWRSERFSKCLTPVLIHGQSHERSC